MRDATESVSGRKDKERNAERRSGMLTVTARRKEDADGDYRPYEEAGLFVKQEIKRGNGTIQEPYCLEMTVRNPGEREWEGVIRAELRAAGEEPRFFLPGFMYGTNRGEAPLNVDNEFPRLRKGEAHRPAAPWWMVRSDRLSHPVAILMNGGRITGLSAGPWFLKKENSIVSWKPGETGEFYQYAGFYCSVQENAVGYTLGYENAPWFYIQSHTVRDRQDMGDNCFRIPPKSEICMEIKVYDDSADQAKEVGEILEKVYWEYHQEPRRAESVVESICAVAGAVSRDAWMETERAYAGFVFENPDGTTWYRKLPSVSWTNGLTVAVPMLLASAIAPEEEGRRIREQALQAIDEIVAGTMDPETGLPRTVCEDGTWSNRGWWFDGMHTPGLSGYLVGQMVYYLLRAWEAEKEQAGTEHAGWMECAEAILDRMDGTCNSDGEYPYILSEKTGAGLEYDAMGSCWILAAMAYHASLTGTRTRMLQMRRSERHYYEQYIRRMECYGAPLDTDKTVDSEGVLAYLRAVRRLHEITGEEQYLDHMKEALNYEFSFKFCYNSPIQTPPLSKVGWSSCGGSITSVANPHIHPMSSTVVDEMNYYLKFRRDDYISSRKRDTVLWSCQNHNRYDREFDYGKRGWMSERFCHCQGLLVQEYPDGSRASTWFALMPWACGSILEGLCAEVSQTGADESAM